jgi:hypothetical protein
LHLFILASFVTKGYLGCLGFRMIPVSVVSVDLPFLL